VRDAEEFRDFAMKGNVLDMAVGIIIGGAFGTHHHEPGQGCPDAPIGLLLGGIDFSNIFLTSRRGPRPARTPRWRRQGRGRGVDQCRPIHQRRDQLPDRGVGGVHAVKAFNAARRRRRRRRPLRPSRLARKCCSPRS